MKPDPTYNDAGLDPDKPIPFVLPEEPQAPDRQATDQCWLCNQHEDECGHTGGGRTVFGGINWSPLALLASLLLSGCKADSNTDAMMRLYADVTHWLAAMPGPVAAALIVLLIIGGVLLAWGALAIGLHLGGARSEARRYAASEQASRQRLFDQSRVIIRLRR